MAYKKILNTWQKDQFYFVLILVLFLSGV